jgi:rhomboid family GlyGly-CTERM serine protease
MMTVVLLLFMITLHWLVPNKAWLYFSAADILNGQVWRIVTGHIMHADLQHLLWNCLGLVVLGTLIEYRSRSMFLAALGLGIVSVSGLLLTPFAQLEYYCGLSGVLNTMLVVALWLEWKFTRSWLVVAIACGSIAKLAFELSQGISIISNISWPPYAWSHVAGLLAGLFVVTVFHPRSHDHVPAGPLVSQY